MKSFIAWITILVTFWGLLNIQSHVSGGVALILAVLYLIVVGIAISSILNADDCRALCGSSLFICSAIAFISPFIWSACDLKIEEKQNEQRLVHLFYPVVNQAYASGKISRLPELHCNFWENNEAYKEEQRYGTDKLPELYLVKKDEEYSVFVRDKCIATKMKSFKIVKKHFVQGALDFIQYTTAEGIIHLIDLQGENAEAEGYEPYTRMVINYDPNF